MALHALIVTDLHYDRDEPHDMPALLGQTIEVVRSETDLDLVILLGDLLQNGKDESAEESLAAIRRVTASLPCLAVPGNHDEGNERIATLFQSAPGLHMYKEVGFILFHHNYDELDATGRSDADLALPTQVRKEHPEIPLVALQHNPLHPTIDAPYPYLPANAEAICNSYLAADIRLSLSGHYHPGQRFHRHKGVWYFTAPAFRHAPHPYALLQIDENKVAIGRRSLI